MLKVILFDLDDTLYSHHQYFRSGFLAVSRFTEMKYGIPCRSFFLTLMTHYHNNDNKKILNETLAHYGIKASYAINELVSVFKKHHPSITLYPNAYLMLEQFQKRYRLGMITDEKRDCQINKINVLKIGHLFEYIICTLDHGYDRRKPSSFCYQMAVNYFRVSPESILYIGNDPYSDFIGARETGMKTLRICQGRFQNVRLNRRFEADYRVCSLQHALTFINKLL